MKDLPKGVYNILDIIFTFLIALCMSLTAIFILSNLLISLLFFIVIVFFACVVLFLCITQNPFNVYLIRAFAFNNFIFTFISLIIFFSKFIPTSTNYIGYILLLFPSGLYLIISFKLTAISLSRDKRAGALLAYTSHTPKEVQRLFVRDNIEDVIKREKLIAIQKEEYRYKLIIALAIALTLSSFGALFFGFY